MEVPIGSIIMWYKSTSLIPAGWFLCDGANGTPDLRGKFVMGISADADKGDPFGAATHDHTNSVAQGADNHVHDVTGTLGGTVSSTGVSEGGSASGVPPAHPHVVDFDVPASGTHTHTTSNVAAVSNLPPYVQVHYIMRAV